MCVQVASLSTTGVGECEAETGSDPNRGGEDPGAEQRGGAGAEDQRPGQPDGGVGAGGGHHVAAELLETPAGTCRQLGAVCPRPAADNPAASGQHEGIVEPFSTLTRHSAADKSSWSTSCSGKLFILAAFSQKHTVHIEMLQMLYLD